MILSVACSFLSLLNNSNDPDVLFPDLPLQDEQAAEELLSGLLDSGNTATGDAAADADAVEEERVREQQEQEQKHLQQQQQVHQHQQLERGIERGIKGPNNSANSSSESENEKESDVSDAEKEGEEERVKSEERIAGDYGEEDDMWTDKEVIMFLSMGSLKACLFFDVDS